MTTKEVNVVRGQYMSYECHASKKSLINTEEKQEEAFFFFSD